MTRKTQVSVRIAVVDHMTANTDWKLLVYMLFKILFVCVGGGEEMAQQ